MANAYEISYESETFSGTRREIANSPEEALAKARESWEEFGDKAPTMWISDTWALSE